MESARRSRRAPSTPCPGCRRTKRVPWPCRVFFRCRSAGPVLPGGRRTRFCRGGAGRREGRSRRGTSSVESKSTRASRGRRAAGRGRPRRRLPSACVRRTGDVASAYQCHRRGLAPANLAGRIGASRVDEVPRLLKVEDEKALLVVDRGRQEPLAARKRALADARRRRGARGAFGRRFF